MAVCHQLWDNGYRDRFEIIYDTDVIFGLRAKLWYPVIKKALELEYPEQAKILPIEPMFRSDDELLPLQAADMFAWCMRNATDKQDIEAYTWLLKEMPNVRGTDYSQYYDLERMKKVQAESERLVRENKAPTEIVDIYRQTRELMKRR